MSTRRYDLAIFDFDGTLADSGEWFFGSLNDVADLFGFRRTTPEEREALRRLGSREIIRQLRVPWWRMPAIARHMRRRAREDVGSFRLFDGIAAELTALREAGVTLAIVSSNAEENARAVLGEKLASSFALLACESSMFGKAAKLRGVMKRLGVAPDCTACVGDETRDIEAARAAGAAPLAVTWGYAAPEALRAAAPELMIDNVAQLRQLLV